MVKNPSANAGDTGLIPTKESSFHLPQLEKSGCGNEVSAQPKINKCFFFKVSKTLRNYFSQEEKDKYHIILLICEI